MRTSRDRSMVVSNREPYLHAEARDGQIVANAATGGVAIALDALMRERGGVWIAHGAGSADRSGRRRAPTTCASHPRARPTRSAGSGWRSRRSPPTTVVSPTKASGRSATSSTCGRNSAPRTGRPTRTSTAALPRPFTRSSGTIDAPVFIQDYHLALVAPRLRALRPDARTALVLAHPVALRRIAFASARGAASCSPGLLGNDLLAFQLERDRDNFLRAVEEELQAEVETESSRVHFAGRSTTVVSVPIGVDYDRIQAMAADPALPAEQQRLTSCWTCGAEIIGLGVDRLDYTKGIPERLAAIDALMTRRPELRGKLTFVQIGVPSRSELESYAAIEAEISQAVADINARHAIRGGPPVVAYHKTALTTASLVALYRLAQFCIVSSLHDGMNLVAKEFVAARDDEDGVLVLSALAGAAQELQDALIINPYDVDGFADALARAIDMPREERRARMMRAAPRRRGPERVRLGIRHPRRARESLDEAAALFGEEVGGHVCLRPVADTLRPRNRDALAGALDVSSRAILSSSRERCSSRKVPILRKTKGNSVWSRLNLGERGRWSNPVALSFHWRFCQPSQAALQ